jgi:hypothetical protein
MKLIFLLISTMSLSLVLGQKCIDKGRGTIGKGACPDISYSWFWGYVQDSGICIGGCCKLYLIFEPNYADSYISNRVNLKQKH